MRAARRPVSSASSPRASASAGASGASSHAPCGNSQNRRPHRVAELLDEPHVVVLERHDHRGRRLLDPRVQPGAPSRASVRSSCRRIQRFSYTTRDAVTRGGCMRGESRRCAARRRGLDSARDLRRDPRALPVLLRAARPPAPAVRLAGPGQLRPVRAAHHGGHASAQAVLPRPGGAAAPPPHDVPEVLPHARHRQGRHHHPPPDVLRDARATSRSATTSSRAPWSSRGSCRWTASASIPSRSGSPSSRATRSSGSARTRRPSRRGCRSACRASGSCRAPRSENFWQAGPIGPCGPCSELYLDRGLEFGTPDDLPGGENERFLEYWNLVFMQYDQDPENVLVPLPKQNIDTGLGPQPHGPHPAGHADDLRDGPVPAADPAGGGALRAPLRRGGRRRPRAAHPRRPHARHVLPGRRRRRALQRGPRLRAAPPHAPRGAAGAADRHRGPVPDALRGRRARAHGRAATPSCTRRPRRSTCGSRREEEAFGQTLEQGTRLLAEHIARARERGAEGIGAEEAFQLHDTYGFPFDLTVELAAEQGLGVDAQGFEDLMDRQRVRARASAGRGGRDRLVEEARDWVGAAGVRTTFTGYETLEQATEVGAVSAADGRLLVKLVDSPFYATGGGQVHDPGVVECESDGLPRGGDGRAALRRGPGARRAHGRRASWRRASASSRASTPRTAAPRRPTTPPPTSSTRRCASASAQHVRQAGSYVGPDKLRFDFTHGQPLSAGGAARRRGPRERVDRRATSPCGPSSRRSTRPRRSARRRCSARSTATRCAWWRSATGAGRASCAAARTCAPPRRSGCSSSRRRRRARPTCAGSRRSPGPVALRTLREHDRVLAEAAALLRTTPENVAELVADRERKRRELEKQREPARGRGRRWRSDARGAHRRRAACSRDGRRRRTRRRCPTWPTGCAASSATRPWWCSAPTPAGA